MPDPTNPSETCFNRVGSDLACKHWTKLKRLVMAKHSSLLPTFVTYGRKMFYNIGPSSTAYEYRPPSPNVWDGLQSDKEIERDWVVDSRPKVGRYEFFTFWSL